MATEFFFNGKSRKLPGIYTQTKSGITNAPLDLSYGNVVVIDSDATNIFGGGSGINGANNQGQDSVYGFDNISDFRNFIKGGKLWLNSSPLFRPNGGENGISNLYYIRSLTTVAASLNMVLTNGSFAIKAKHEGLVGNGYLGNETKASQIVTITNTGAASDTIDVKSDLGAGAITLGVFTSTGAETPAQAAIALAAAINIGTTGFTANPVNDTVVVTAPMASGSDANAYTFTSTASGTATSTVGAALFTNGVDGTKLTRGLALSIEAGVVDPNKFIFKLLRGSYTGLDADGQAYDGISEENTVSEVLLRTKELDTLADLYETLENDFNFNNNFILTSPTGTGAIITADLTNNLGPQIFTGGSQTSASTDLDKVLESITALDYTFVYSLNGGSLATNVENGKILNHIKNEAKYEKFMVVAGGETQNDFVSQSVAAAKYYNDDSVMVVHGGVKVQDQTSATGTKEYDATYHSAAFLGRMAGLEPQTPVTFKALGIAGVKHNLTEAEKEVGLDNGVLMTAFDSELQSFAVVAGVNTLQAPKNNYTVNEDGASHLISIKRIAAQLNKELEFNAKIQLLGNQSQGPNRATLSAEVIKDWLKGYLIRKTATTTQDNLILSFRNINVKVDQDAFFIEYSFVPNFEVNKIFITGFIIDPNL